MTDHQRSTPHEDRADRLARRFAVPVLIAALAAVPAVFLTLLEEPWSTVGDGLNALSGSVLVAETVVLLAVAEDKRAWLRRNKWLVALAAVIVPAVIFAIGPVQLLRLVRVVGALRIVRIKRIIKAGRVLRERAGLTAGWQRVIAVVVTLLSAGFVAVVLADPSSPSREWLLGAVDLVGWPGVVLAGIILAVATYVVRTARDDEDEDTDETDDKDDTDDTDADPVGGLAADTAGGAGRRRPGSDEARDDGRSQPPSTSTSG